MAGFSLFGVLETFMQAILDGVKGPDRFTPARDRSLSVL